jgi:hypothetical protein
VRIGYGLWIVWGLVEVVESVLRNRAKWGTMSTSGRPEMAPMV